MRRNKPYRHTFLAIIVAFAAAFVVDQGLHSTHRETDTSGSQGASPPLRIPDPIRKELSGTDTRMTLSTGVASIPDIPSPSARLDRGNDSVRRPGPEQLQILVRSLTSTLAILVQFLGG